MEITFTSEHLSVIQTSICICVFPVLPLEGHIYVPLQSHSNGFITNFSVCFRSCMSEQERTVSAPSLCNVTLFFLCEVTTVLPPVEKVKTLNFL